MLGRPRGRKEAAMRRLRQAFLVSLALLALTGCFARHTYYVELTNGQYFYVDPPMVLDADRGVYYMYVAGKRRVVAMEDVSFIDTTAQICYQNGYADTDTFTCYDALYQW